MNRSVKKVDASHNQTTFVMQSTSERDEWLRTFPAPLPTTHALEYQWTDPMTLIVGPALKKPAAADGGAAAEARGKLQAKLVKMDDSELATFAAEKSVTLPKALERSAKIGKILDQLTPEK